MSWIRFGRVGLRWVGIALRLSRGGSGGGVWAAWCGRALDPDTRQAGRRLIIGMTTLTPAVLAGLVAHYLLRSSFGRRYSLGSLYSFGKHFPFFGRRFVIGVLSSPFPLWRSSIGRRFVIGVSAGVSASSAIRILLRIAFVVQGGGVVWAEPSGTGSDTRNMSSPEIAQNGT